MALVPQLNIGLGFLSVVALQLGLDAGLIGPQRAPLRGELNESPVALAVEPEERPEQARGDGWSERRVGLGLSSKDNRPVTIVSVVSPIGEVSTGWITPPSEGELVEHLAGFPRS